DLPFECVVHVHVTAFCQRRNRLGDWTAVKSRGKSTLGSAQAPFALDPLGHIPGGADDDWRLATVVQEIPVLPDSDRPRIRLERHHAARSAVSTNRVEIRLELIAVLRGEEIAERHTQQLFPPEA